MFFGVVATAGSAYVQEESLSGLALAASVPVGLLATALLVVNNLRDIPGDTASGKRTLAVRLGDRRTRWFYVGLLVGAVVMVPVVAAVGDRAGAALALAAGPAGPTTGDRGARRRPWRRARPGPGGDGTPAARLRGPPGAWPLADGLSTGDPPEHGGRPSGLPQPVASDSHGSTVSRNCAGCSRWALWPAPGTSATWALATIAAAVRRAMAA